MFLRNGLQPWHLMVVALVVILLFGSKKLPESARSLGKSLRILKSETRAMRKESEDGETGNASEGTTTEPLTESPGAPPAAPPTTPAASTASTPPTTPTAPATPATPTEGATGTPTP